MWCICFFFFKQKTAYEMLRSLVGSEMCIRDRPIAGMETRAMRIEGGGGRRGRPTTISKNMRKDYDYIPSHTSNLLVPLPIITVYPVSYTHLTLPTIYPV